MTCVQASGAFLAHKCGKYQTLRKNGNIGKDSRPFQDALQHLVHSIIGLKVHEIAICFNSDISLLFNSK